MTAEELVKHLNDQANSNVMLLHHPFIEIKIVQDNDGHDYIIRAEDSDLFSDLLENDENQFNKRFASRSVGGDPMANRFFMKAGDFDKI